MTDLVHLVSPLPPYAEFKTQALKLAPFLNFVVIYFAFLQHPTADLSTTLLKCAPIVSLMFYVLTKGFGLTKDYKCSQRILLGLIFSCGGDALLNLDLFPHGMGSFAVAQVCYISAFGFKPWKWIIGLPLYAAGIILIGIVFKSLEGVLIVGLPVYALLLITMCWRSLARAADKKTFLYGFCAFGSILFVISDGLIGIDMFLISVPNSRLWIMSTYYLAQFAITLSTANECSQKKASKSGSPKNRSRNNSARRRANKTKD